MTRTSIMPIITMLFAACLTAQPRIEAVHSHNSVYSEVLNGGLDVDAAGEKFTLPAPRLLDDQDANAQRSALREVATSDQALEEMFRPSVTAPYIIKVRDAKAPDGIIRAVDLWFVVYADPKQVDPAKEAERTDQKEVEVGNMWFQTRLLKADELRTAGINTTASSTELKTWYAHVHARLLGRIDFEVTNQVVASRSNDSVVIASRTEAAFAKDGPNRNGWKTLASAGVTNQGRDAIKPYPGGISYAKMSRVAFKPGALLVEMHFAFVEPNEWFQGAPILRSKFSVAAQDQIRSLRREIAQRQKK
jgi:hypothetical protein